MPSAVASKLTEMVIRPEEYALFEWVPLGKIFRDRYCRPLNEAYIRRIASAWSMRRVGVLYLSFHSDDRYALLDGGHRWAAAQVVGQEQLPAWVFLDLTYAEEAELFAALNTIARVSALDRFRALLEAGDPETKAIHALLLKHRLDVALEGRGPGKITAVYALQRVVHQYGMDVLDKTIGLLYDAWQRAGSAYTSISIPGTAAFLERYIHTADRKRLVEKLTAIGPDRLLSRANAIMEAMGIRMERTRAWGRAMLAIYNDGLKTQRLPEWQERTVAEKARASAQLTRLIGTQTLKIMEALEFGAKTPKEIVKGGDIEASAGYVKGQLYALTKRGWSTRSPIPGANQFRYRLSEGGRTILVQTRQAKAVRQAAREAARPAGAPR